MRNKIRDMLMAQIAKRGAREKAAICASDGAVRGAWREKEVILSVGLWRYDHSCDAYDAYDAYD